MSRETDALIEKARRSIAAAKRLLNDGDADFAASRAYFGMFHVAEALLLSRGLTYSKHSGVIAGLHEHFVRTGELPREHFDAFRKAFEVRSTADYGYLEPFPVGSARGLIGRAEAFVSEVEALLRRPDAT